MFSSLESMFVHILERKKKNGRDGIELTYTQLPSSQVSSSASDPPAAYEQQASSAMQPSHPNMAGGATSLLKIESAPMITLSI